MAFPLRILLTQPESQSALFLIGNVVLFILLVLSRSYSLIYALVHLAAFVVINRWLASGRFYASTKNLSDQTVVITGAAAGIGRATAVELAKLHARVIVGIRGQTRAERVARELSELSNGQVIGYHLDLGDLASVKAFAEKIDRVDILINNAGLTRHKEEWTKDGLESTFATNHIGHFYLTELLLPLLLRSRGRIVNVSSVAHAFVGADVDFSKSKPYRPLVAYAESKLANILHAVELQRRYGHRGVNAYALHPGGIMSTELTREKNAVQAVLMSPLLLISKSIPQGAMTTLYCALSDEAQPGKYHSDCRVAQANPVAFDATKATELWQFSETVVKDKTKHL